MTPSPNAFLHTPPYGAHHPSATPTQQVQEPRVGYAITPGPGNTLPLLSIAFPNTCTFTKALLARLNLRGGSWVHLVVPGKRNGSWYLDTRPKEGVGSQLPKSGRCKFRVPPISPQHFQQSQPSRKGFAPIRNTQLPLLHFELGEEVAGEPGHYRLRRVTRAVHH